MKPLEYIPRLISTHIQKLMDMYPIVTIAGPRQSGKTTLARHLYPHSAASTEHTKDLRFMVFGR